MKDIATLAIPTTTLCRLLQYAEAHQSETNAGELAALAIEEWLAPAADLFQCRGAFAAIARSP